MKTKTRFRHRIVKRIKPLRDSKKIVFFDYAGVIASFPSCMIATQLLRLDKPVARGLCLEFILHDYAKALAVAKKLEGSSAEDAISLLELLSADAIRDVPYRSYGILDRLCFYCEALVQITSIGEDLLDVLDELRTAVLFQRTQLLRRFRQDASSSCGSSPPSFHGQLQKFFTFLLPVLEASAQSEATIFALVEQRQEIQAHIDHRPIDSLLQHLFPEGPRQLQNFLSDAFAARGFDDFCKRHEGLFKDLAWERVQL